MNIDQFTQSHGFSTRDSFVANKIYKGQDHSESEWNDILKPDFNFHDMNEKLPDEGTDNKKEVKSKTK